MRALAALLSRVLGIIAVNLMIYSLPFRPVRRQRRASNKAQLRRQSEWVRAGCAWLRLRALIFTGIFAMLHGHAQAQVLEYQLKAAFLSSFTEFVTWPAASFSGAAAPIVIGVLGADPFGSALDSAVQGKLVGNRKIVVRRVQRVEDAKNCHVVFISKSERARVAEILAGLGTASVLTVADIDQFTRQGGAIGFKMSGGNVLLEINQGAAQQAGLGMSSRLLKLSR